MKKTIASLILASLILSACATTAPAAHPPEKPRNLKEWVLSQNRARRQAMVGAIIGGILGAATAGGSREDRIAGAIAGAAAGALAGYALGAHKDKIYAARDMAVLQARYDASQGYVAQIEQISFNPPTTKPGQTTTLYVRYHVIGPNPNEPIKVTMFRGLKYQDDYILGAGPNEFVVPKGGGIVEATMPVTFSAKAAQGTYSAEAWIEDPAGRFKQVIETSSLYVIARAETHDVTGVASR